MSKLDEVKAKLDSLEPRIAALEEVAQAQGAEVAEVESRTNDLVSRVTNLEEFFSAPSEAPVENVPTSGDDSASDSVDSATENNDEPKTSTIS